MTVGQSEPARNMWLGALGTDTAHIPWDFLYRVTDNNVLDGINVSKMNMYVYTSTYTHLSSARTHIYR